MRLPDRRIHQFRRQRGVVLFISLIMLVAMTLAGIALVRSVDTTNLIAGNLAFKQGATLAADNAVELGRGWLITQNNSTMSNDITTDCGNPNPPPLPVCYYSSTPPIAGVSGTETPWPQYNWTGSSFDLGKDAADNQVSYVTQRLCKNGNVAPDSTSCISVTSTPPCIVAGDPCPAGPTQYYYRVTAKVTGPRNTVSYVQAVIQI
jgi:type IV pilus assembly protein PilX